MKTFQDSPIIIYVCASLACICLMIIVDFVLGAEAEHLNAWVIVNKLLRRETHVGDSLAIKHLGLYGASFLMIGLNVLFGIMLIQVIKITVRFFHS